MIAVVPVVQGKASTSVFWRHSESASEDALLLELGEVYHMINHKLSCMLHAKPSQRATESVCMMDVVPVVQGKARTSVFWRRLATFRICP